MGIGMAMGNMKMLLNDENVINMNSMKENGRRMRANGKLNNSKEASGQAGRQAGRGTLKENDKKNGKYI